MSGLAARADRMTRLMALTAVCMALSCWLGLLDGAAFTTLSAKDSGTRLSSSTSYSSTAKFIR